MGQFGHGTAAICTAFLVPGPSGTRPRSPPVYIHQSGDIPTPPPSYDLLLTGTADLRSCASRPKELHEASLRVQWPHDELCRSEDCKTAGSSWDDAGAVARTAACEAPRAASCFPLPGGPQELSEVEATALEETTLAGESHPTGQSMDRVPHRVDAEPTTTGMDSASSGLADLLMAAS